MDVVTIQWLREAEACEEAQLAFINAFPTGMASLSLVLEALAEHPEVVGWSAWIRLRLPFDRQALLYRWWELLDATPDRSWLLSSRRAARLLAEEVR